MENSTISKADPVNVTGASKDGESKLDLRAPSITEIDFEEQVNDPILYSKRSIFFMVLFSGLAIGSDAYNSALMGQLLLLLVAMYPNSLNVATQSQLTNAFIIGLVSLNAWFACKEDSNTILDFGYACFRISFRSTRSKKWCGVDHLVSFGWHHYDCCVAWNKRQRSLLDVDHIQRNCWIWVRSIQR